MLFKEKYISDVGTFIKRRIKSLLVPYFLYEIFYIFITWLIFYITGKWWGEALTVKNLLLTPFLNGHQMDLSCPLWFVPQLFITLLTFLFLMKVILCSSCNIFSFRFLCDTFYKVCRINRHKSFNM